MKKETKRDKTETREKTFIRTISTFISIRRQKPTPNIYFRISDSITMLYYISGTQQLSNIPVNALSNLLCLYKTASLIST